MAVGGVQVYTTQIKKARDSNRIQDMMSLRNGFESYYLDHGQNYLRRGDHTMRGEITQFFREDFKNYVTNIENIQDSKDACSTSCQGNPIKSCASYESDGATKRTFLCGYVYRPSYDRQTYEISTGFESWSNVCLNGEGCRSDEGGNNQERFEIGTNLSINTFMYEYPTGEAGIISTLDSPIGGGAAIQIHSKAFTY